MTATTDVDTRLHRLWTRLLEGAAADGPGDDADFFADGGTSLQAVLLAAAVQEEFAVPLDAVEVVATPSRSQLAALIGTRLTAVR